MPSKSPRSRASAKPSRRTRSATKPAKTPAVSKAVVLEARRQERERRARELKAQREIDRRVKSYFTTRVPLPPRPTGVRAGAGLRAPVAPIRVIAEGDSWFDYPVPFAGGGIIPRLSVRMKRVLARGVILNLAHYGHEARFMLGVAQRKTLIDSLRREPFDALLFSGGGNDIVGDQCSLWLRDRSSVARVEDAIRVDVFNAALRVVRAAYEDLFALRDQFASQCTIFLHGYCFPFPQNKGVCGVGPWLWPALVQRGWTESADQIQIARDMLARYGVLLRELASAAPKVVYIDTQAIDLSRAEWGNEIHPTNDGFTRVTDLFESTLKTHFGLA